MLEKLLKGLRHPTLALGFYALGMSSYGCNGEGMVSGGSMRADAGREDAQADAGKNCLDNDDDGFYDRSGCGTDVDCDDNNKMIFPGALEFCDYTDNNCDGNIDESYALSDACDNGLLGECFRNGEYRCSADGSGTECSAPLVEGSAEECDGLDNDCDEVSDNNLTALSQECFAGIGECRRSGLEYRVCEGNAGWSADYRNCDALAGAPAEEICDGLDNDCDGVSDNNLTALSQECFTGIGECARAGLEEQVCEGAAGWSADYRNCDALAGAPAEEICDGLDNNCDGTADNTLTAPSQECYAGIGECRAAGAEYQVCEGAAGWSADYRNCNAVASEPAEEICNGLDNDCDGTADNALTAPSQECYAGIGECRAAGLEYQVCEGAAGWSTDFRNCNAVAGEPAEEICNGADDNCDGSVDNGLTPESRECIAGRGECARAGLEYKVCEGAAGWSVGYSGCTAVEGAAGVEACNGLDDDCNGIVDNDCVEGEIRVIQIAAGSAHTCALLAGGAVRCWGYNENGQLGDDTTTTRSTPRPVHGIANGEQIALGNLHSCTLLDDGTTRCWGDNRYGQLGDGTTSRRYIPTPVSELENATQVALGTYHTCSVLDDGTARCWGSNFLGQLGGGPGADRSTPILVSELTNAARIALGSLHTCALLDNSAVRCWGDNSSGQLGDGTIATRYTPTLVSGLTNAAQVSLGSEHTCARLADSTVRCWGDNRFGQLGDGTTINRSLPVSVSELENVTQIALGSRHTCALLDDGAVRCWGYNWNGQLGDGTTIDRHTPTPVFRLDNAERIAIGSSHACALLDNGAVRCWGWNAGGQLGDGTRTDRYNPSTVIW